MARIRSVHPGFFTDEDLVCVSSFARLLIIGLGIEADDKGVFEWKPLTIKMRLFPADNIDVPDLLAELHNQDAIKKYEIGGRKYGAIRNFRKHQRPKTPNDIHPIPDDLRNYVGLTDNITEKKPVKKPSFPPKGEIPPQMEDGGDKMEGEEESKNRASAPKKSDAVIVRENLSSVVGDEQVSSIIQFRQKIRKPLTPRASKLLAGKLSKASCPNDAADLMIERGWTGFDVSWLERVDIQKARGSHLQIKNQPVTYFEE